MRFFEIALISILSIQMLIDVLKLDNSKALRKTVLISALALLILHITIEGYRWQMIPAYLLTTTVLMFKVVNASHKILLLFRNLLFGLLLVVAVFLPTALPILAFNNEGDFQVGLREYQIQSERGEFITKDSTDKREISIRMYYPAEGPIGGKIDYIPDFDIVKSYFAAKVGWPAFMIDYLRYAYVEGEKGAKIQVEGKYPIVFYSHGLTNNYTEASGRMMHIASRGYIVVAINHTFSSNYAILSDGDIVSMKLLSRLGDPIEKVDSVKSLLAMQWVEDVKDAINELKNDSFASSIDFERIGLMGFSAGGTMAVLGSYEIANVKVSINLDGTPRSVQVDSAANCPHLILFSEPKYYPDSQLEAWGINRGMIDGPLRLKLGRAQKIAKNTKGDNFLAVVAGTEHSNFIEYPLISPYSHLLGIGGTIDSYQCYDMINDLIFGFLDRELKGKSYVPSSLPELKTDIDQFIPSEVPDLN